MSSIYKVAQKAGVSVATVSRVINNKSCVSREMVESIHKVMQNLNYVPRSRGTRPGPKSNAAARIRTKVIAFVVGNRELETNLPHTPFYTHILHAAEGELAAHGLAMMYTVISDPEKMPVCIEENKVDGLLLFHLDPDELGVPEKTEKLLKCFPSITVLGNRQMWCDHISYNNQAIGGCAAEYLLSRGHKRVAQISLGQSDNAEYERIRTFQTRMERGSAQILTFNGSALIRRGISELESEQELEKIINELAGVSPLPTGIYIPLGTLTKALYRVLQRRGIIPGKDIEVVSVNKEPPLISGLEPRPAVVDLRSDAIGRCAVKRLLWRLENPEEEPLTLLLEPLLAGPCDGGIGIEYN
jgi:LacI family transcriptional regulator